MKLDEAQKSKVAHWIAEGLKLSEIQSRLDSELGVRMTYMEVRFLVDDLKLTPKDPEPPKSDSSLLQTPAAGVKPTAAPGRSPAPPAAAPSAPAPKPGQVSVSVDQLTRAGAIVSGKVTFSDGHQAEWFIDQMGRPGLVPQKAGYRPSPQDVQQFQAALDVELSKLGF
jgi:hypothetical protein